MDKTVFKRMVRIGRLPETGYPLKDDKEFGKTAGLINNRARRRMLKALQRKVTK